MKTAPNLIGQVCTCENGIEGFVLRRVPAKSVVPSPVVKWQGVRMDGGGNWESTKPKVVAKSLIEYHRIQVERLRVVMLAAFEVAVSEVYGEHIH